MRQEKLTDEEIAERVASKLTGRFYVGQKVKLFSGATAIITDARHPHYDLVTQGRYGGDRNWTTTYDYLTAIDK